MEQLHRIVPWDDVPNQGANGSISNKEESAPDLQQELESSKSKNIPQHTENSSRRIDSISTQLFGRENETASLLQAYQRRLSASNSQEFIMLSGKSGTGKTALAQQTLQPLVTANEYGYYLSGKFDQQRHPKPFAPFVEAMTQFANTLRPDHIIELQRNMRQEIDQQLLVRMIPALDSVFGEESTPDSSKSITEEVFVEHKTPTDMHRQLFLVSFTMFMRVICESDLVVVLFLDDLQWADFGSLDLLHMLMTSKYLNSLVLVGACRCNEVSSKDDLAAMLRSLESSGVTVFEVRLQNLDVDGVVSFIASQLELPYSECESLGHMIYAQTDGNIFFTKRYIINMFHQEAFRHDGVRYRWDEKLLEETVGKKSAVQLITINMKRIHKDCEYILKVASCLGASFDEKLLSLLVPEEMLRPCVDNLIEMRTFVKGEDKLLFAHDQLQNACYSMIDEANRPIFHLELGEKLKAGMSDKELERNLFVVASQFVRGMPAVTSEQGRYDCSLLCLQAGQKAVLLASFETAAAYMNAGIDCLGPRAFQEHYRLSLALYNTAAEVAYCNGKQEKMQELIQEVLHHARNHHDKLQAYSTKIVALNSTYKLQEAIELGFLVLRLLGEPVPARVGLSRTAFELTKTKRMLRGWTASTILNLPPLTNQDKIVAMKILDLIFPAVVFGKPEYVAFVVCRYMQWTVKYGLNVLSGSGFAIYGILLTSLGSKEDAYKYGSIGMQIIEKYGNKQWAPRVQLSFHGMIQYWREPMANTLEPLKKVYYSAQKTGDFECAAMSGFLYAVNAEFAGFPIPVLIRYLREFRDTMMAYGQEIILSFLLSDLQAFANLNGQADDPMVLSGEYMVEEEGLRKCRDANNFTGEFVIEQARLQSAFYLGEFEIAEAICDKLQISKQRRVEELAKAVTTFHESVTALALYRKDSRSKHWKNVRRLKVARKGLKLMRQHAADAPSNFLDKAYFLEAEMIAVKGDLGDALTLYRLAVSLAEREGFIHEEALYYERMAVALEACSKTREAKESYKKARELYTRWGCILAADRLEKVLQAGSW